MVGWVGAGEEGRNEGEGGGWGGEVGIREEGWGGGMKKERMTRMGRLTKRAIGIWRFGVTGDWEMLAFRGI